eukprot:CAMPEP_0117483692 /NCGR_PEP_ID=MMETSP0784-20121206/14071_1 /TAXON_ID=39447 /ORGANISM="" /LENGTH=164 /DNA_ID=CAMNT_0005278237 /DNA_START=463 /DNA_END=960 /DNA_ORIENTATION=+
MVAHVRRFVHKALCSTREQSAFDHHDVTNTDGANARFVADNMVVVPTIKKLLEINIRVSRVLGGIAVVRNDGPANIMILVPTSAHVFAEQFELHGQLPSTRHKFVRCVCHGCRILEHELRKLWRQTAGNGKRRFLELTFEQGFWYQQIDVLLVDNVVKYVAPFP